MGWKLMRALVIGATGQLGRELLRAFRQRADDGAVGLGHDEIEVTDPTSVNQAIQRDRPDVVVNCAAFVRVDDCEDQPGQAFHVNAVGALHVARASRHVGARCVYVSTDYVFDGRKAEPYTEDDPPRPLNVYGASKLAGEYLVQQVCPDALVVRMASLFGGRGARGKGSNFVLTVLDRARRKETLRVVNDVRMSPTYAVDAAQALVQLVQRGASGVFHVVNEGSCTWYEFARRAVALAGLETSVEPVLQVAFPTKARRPPNSALSPAKLRSVGLWMPSWEDALSRYLTDQVGVTPSGRAGD
jgi:dTDP-4-dehydrorhamnose reductase